MFCDCESLRSVEVGVVVSTGGVDLFLGAGSGTSSSLVFRFKFDLLGSGLDSCGVVSSIWRGR